MIKTSKGTTILQNSHNSKEIILLVDDDEEQLILLHFFLKSYYDGFEFISFESVDQALKFLSIEERRIQVSLIISDFFMFPLNGLEFLKTIRNNDLTIPFILYSGFLSNQTKLEAEKFDVAKCIEKGPDPKRLIDEIANYLLI